MNIDKDTFLGKLLRKEKDKPKKEGPGSIQAIRNLACEFKGHRWFKKNDHYEQCLVCSKTKFIP
jgi:hypothetical protein